MEDGRARGSDLSDDGAPSAGGTFGSGAGGRRAGAIAGYFPAARGVATVLGLDSRAGNGPAQTGRRWLSPDPHFQLQALAVTVDRQGKLFTDRRNLDCGLKHGYTRDRPAAMLTIRSPGRSPASEAGVPGFTLTMTSGPASMGRSGDEVWTGSTCTPR